MSVFLELTGPQRAELQEALSRAYPGVDPLAQMLGAQLDKQLFNYVGTGLNLQLTLFNLLGAAQAEGWLADLILAALRHNPRPHPRLAAVAQGYGLMSVPPQEQASLERLLGKSSGLIDVGLWQGKLGTLQRHVCRVEASMTGTGFLVGPDLVFTNYHVVEAEIKQTAAQAQVVCRFDYAVIQSDGQTHVVSNGTPFRLSSEWLLDYSPYSRFDLSPDPKPGVPGNEELDYALLRLELPAGELPVGHREAIPGASPRGFIDAQTAVPQPAVGDPLLLLQHPQGQPLKMAFATKAVERTDGIGPRLRHTIDTLSGSSGSPCFNLDLGLVALHHAGDPARPDLASYNQAVPLPAIRTLLEKRGKLAMLVVPPP